MALAVGVALGVSQDKPKGVEGAWRNLRWRVVWYQAIYWALSLVLFLCGLDAWDELNGWRTFLVVGTLLVIVGHGAERLLTKFHCPHCGEFFFPSKLDQRDGAGLLFGMKLWSNTRCENCAWPLWKPITEKAPEPAPKPASR